MEQTEDGLFYIYLTVSRTPKSHFLLFAAIGSAGYRTKKRHPKKTDGRRRVPLWINPIGWWKPSQMGQSRQRGW